MIDFPISPDDSPRLVTTEYQIVYENDRHYEEYYTEDPVEKIRTVYGISIMGFRKYYRNDILDRIEPVFPQQ